MTIAADVIKPEFLLTDLAFTYSIVSSEAGITHLGTSHIADRRHIAASVFTRLTLSNGMAWHKRQIEGRDFVPACNLNASIFKFQAALELRSLEYQCRRFLPVVLAVPEPADSILLPLLRLHRSWC